MIASRLLSGTNVVLVGSLGSGKSHLVRDVVARLRCDGADPLVLRSGGPLSGVAFGALETARDPRVARLRDDAVPDGSRMIVVIDDADELDDATATAVVRAAYRGTATVLFAVAVSRDGWTTGLRGASAAGQLAVDLWLRGLAERVDLTALSASEAEQLIAGFGGSNLDAISRAAVIGLANGSRMLLRELTREALTAAASGRDPISALRDAPPHGRLSDAVAAHVAELSPAERSALRVLGVAPRIAYADAVRVVPAGIVDQLLATGLVHDDDTAERRLTANGIFAREAEGTAADDEIACALAATTAQMLEPDAAWWSRPLAYLIARRWVRGEPGTTPWESVDVAIRRRVAVDAARAANDSGDYELAASFARLAMTDGADVMARAELLYADAARGFPVDVRALAGAIARTDLDADAQRRWSWMTALLALTMSGTGATPSALPPAAEDDPVTASEVAFRQAQAAGLHLHWVEALEHAVPVASLHTATVSLRMRASALAGVCHAGLGDAGQAQTWFAAVRRLADDRSGTTDVTTRERLWVLDSEVLAHALAGTDARLTLERLEREYAATAREDEQITVAIAGLVAAATAAHVGDADRALIELRAATRRVRTPLLATWLAWTQIVVAYATAVQERWAEARAVLDEVDPAQADHIPLLAHARMVAETHILAAEGRGADAVAAARAATEVAEYVPTLLARDLFQLVALGDDSDVILARMHRIAETTTVPAPHVLDERARELLSARARDHRIDPSSALRMGAVWGVNTASDSATAPFDRRGVPSPTPDVGLTRREREIALLVSEGLSNREIATRLYLSVRTVESHIYQARAKVDARSRGELGQRVAATTETRASA